MKNFIPPHEYTSKCPIDKYLGKKIIALKKLIFKWDFRWCEKKILYATHTAKEHKKLFLPLSLRKLYTHRTAIYWKIPRKKN